MKLYLQTEVISTDDLLDKKKLTETLLSFSINDPDMISDSKLSEAAKELYITYGEMCAVESINMYSDKYPINCHVIEAIVYNFVQMWFDNDPDILDKCQCVVTRVDNHMVISLSYYKE